MNRFLKSAICLLLPFVLWQGLYVPGPNDYSINGRFWEHHYEFTRKGKTVATVAKTPWSWRDSYGVDIISGEDDVAILCAVIVIDQISHDGES